MMNSDEHGEEKTYIMWRIGNHHSDIPGVQEVRQERHTQVDHFSSCKCLRTGKCLQCEIIPMLHLFTLLSCRRRDDNDQHED